MSEAAVFASLLGLVSEPADDDRESTSAPNMLSSFNLQRSTMSLRYTRP